MGKQITFFMLDIDEREFLKHVTENGDILISSYGERVAVGNVILSKERQFYIANEESKILIKENGFIDALRSDTIEFLRCTVKSEKLVSYGRLWVELKYLDEKGNSVHKGDWLNKKLSMYKKWIEKNYKISKCKGYYIGSETYDLYLNSGYSMMATPVLKIEF